MRSTKKQSNSSTLPLTLNELKKQVESKIINSQDLTFTIYEQESNNLENKKNEEKSDKQTSDKNKNSNGKQENKKIAVLYIPYLVDQEKIENQLLSPLLDMQTDWSSTAILNEIPLGSGKKYSDLKNIADKLNEGEVIVYVEKEEEIVTYKLAKIEKRSLDKAENEAIVVGPQLAFTESIITNINVLSWRLNTPDLAMEKIEIGKSNPKETRLIYLQSVANETDVDTMRQRIKELEIDMVEDTHMLKQYLLDSSTSVFPQYVSTELIDHAMYSVKQGKIVVLLEDSPLALVAPSSLFSFFQSTEDRYFHWNLSTFILWLRFFAVFAALLLTPMYVAATTFHYELIPTQLLVSLGQSRAIVPFPPVIEVILLELVIELLREAGARLPTKVGQTIGIVGGVVVGTAAVQAGITSNVLIILVTLSALASFSSPNYVMGNTVRIIRFPLVILAGFYGIIGIMFGLCLLVIHLLRLESLGRPYLVPLYPLRLADFNKSFFRLPMQKQGRRFLSYQLKDKRVFDKEKAIHRKDTDE